MNLIIYESNIYVNNSKYISIIDNISVLQLSLDPWGPFYLKIYSGLTVFNIIVSRRCIGSYLVILPLLITFYFILTFLSLSREQSRRTEFNDKLLALKFRFSNSRLKSEF